MMLRGKHARRQGQAILMATTAAVLDGSYYVDLNSQLDTQSHDMIKLSEGCVSKCCRIETAALPVATPMSMPTPTYTVHAKQMQSTTQHI